MKKASQSDDELWRDILDGNSRSFATFYDRYWLRMYKAAFYYLRDVDSSEEVVQEVFILIWNRRHTLDIKNFSAYLNSATRYQVFRKLKANKHTFEELHDDSINAGIVYNLGYEKLNELDNMNLLQECLQGLPKRCQEIFFMSKIRNLSNTQIAEQLGVSKHTVENQVAIALKYVKLNFSKITTLLLLLFKAH